MSYRIKFGKKSRSNKQDDNSSNGNEKIVKAKDEIQDFGP
jgi:hypothetical protein